MTTRPPIDYDGYDSDLEEPPPKKPLIAPSMNSKPEHRYKTTKEPLNGFTSYEDKEAWRIQAFHLRKMDAYTRHKELIRNYVKYYGGKLEDFKRDGKGDRNDYSVLVDHHQFLWSTDATSWEERLAKRYYDKLFKEYCIGDLSRYAERKIALRWRTEPEVRTGKGQFSCGEKRCSERDSLSSWEVNFSYSERGEKKSALVKIRLCHECSIKLNMIKKVRKVSKKHNKKRKKKRGVRSSTEEDKGEDSGAEVKGIDEKTEDEPSTSGQTDESNIWKGPAPETQIKTAAEEIDEFLDDLLL